MSVLHIIELQIDKIFVTNPNDLLTKSSKITKFLLIELTSESASDASNWFSIQRRSIHIKEHLFIHRSSKSRFVHITMLSDIIMKVVLQVFR